MGSNSRPHAVFVPYPAQGHVTPLLQLAKVLHARGFFITYVNSEYNHRRLLRSRGAEAMAGLDDFRFEAIPDGLPPSGDDDVTQDIPALCESLSRNAAAPYLTNGYLEDTVLDWVPGMPGIRLRDMPSFIRTTDPDDFMVHFDGGEAQNALHAQGIIVNTFDELEQDVVDALRRIFPRVYTIGPLVTFVKTMVARPDTAAIAGNLWKEDASCLQWLDARRPGSVVYVNFGSITVMTPGQLAEFAWGLASCGRPFLWVIRPDLVTGEKAVLPEEFFEETKERGMFLSWCPQEEVLSHPSTGLFLTHSGWNSTLESICAGVPMICWPFFAEQTTNCYYACTKWDIGMEIDNNVTREEVARLIKEAMDGEKGKDMKVKATMWKEKAVAATEEGGTSSVNVDRLVGFMLEGSVPTTAS
nr:unnamed protein product [Digitaria exilis]